MQTLVDLFAAGADRAGADAPLLLLPDGGTVTFGEGAAQAAAMAAGAWGCTLSGSGPAIFAVAASLERAQEVAGALQGGLRGAGLDSTARLCGLDRQGARLIA